jgi:hypothetical protein
MLLHIMSFPGYIRRNNSPSTQPHSRSFPLCGVRFLGSCNADFETDAFELCGVDGRERWRDGFAGFLWDAAALYDGSVRRSMSRDPKGPEATMEMDRGVSVGIGYVLVRPA